MSPEQPTSWHHCRDCDVTWNGPPTCWVCGREVRPMTLVEAVRLSWTVREPV